MKLALLDHTGHCAVAPTLCPRHPPVPSAWPRWAQLGTTMLPPGTLTARRI